MSSCLFLFIARASGLWRTRSTTFSSAFRQMFRRCDWKMRKWSCDQYWGGLIHCVSRGSEFRYSWLSLISVSCSGMSFLCHHGTRDLGHDLQVHAKCRAHFGEEGRSLPRCITSLVRGPVVANILIIADPCWSFLMMLYNGCWSWIHHQAFARMNWPWKVSGSSMWQLRRLESCHQFTFSYCTGWFRWLSSRLSRFIQVPFLISNQMIQMQYDMQSSRGKRNGKWTHSVIFTRHWPSLKPSFTATHDARRVKLRWV